MSEELINLISTIEFSGEDDVLIWQHNSSGLYFSQSLYSIVNFRGVAHVYLPSVWKLVLPLGFIFSFGYSLITRF
jgi:hypothetical protein